VAFELLVEQRRQARAAADAPQREVAVVGDVADRVADFVETAVDDAFGSAAARATVTLPVRSRTLPGSKANKLSVMACS